MSASTRTAEICNSKWSTIMWINPDVGDICGGVTTERYYVGRLKSNAHMLAEREQKQIARSGKT
jgi:hypothetical protein